MIKNKNNYIIIYGYHPIKEAILSNNKNIKILIIIIDKNKINKYNFLINIIKKKKISLKYTNKKYIEKIIYNNKNKKKKNYQGLISYILYKKYILKNFIINNKKKLIILILYNITDTKNIGSIIRSSVCFNIDLIIIQNNYWIFNPDIIKISSGSIFKIPICRVNNYENTINYLKNNKIKILSITEKSKKSCINYFNNLKEKVSIALILGNEEKGISKNIIKISNDIIKIPIEKKILSLNVSVACGIILYEIYKYKLNY
ncbi:MAG: RNA methyltransferase [Candidatus Shikimatogenerans bostrichidophilus]|nr:MAG: RNA methyltransferase [Candidatus Shikimatogenerans bostrichidophilus]